MAFNGSGTFSRTNGTHSGSTTWQQDEAATLDILSTLHDSHDQDIADGLTNCITKDGQTTPTANIPFGGFKLTNVGAGTSRTDGARVAQVQDSQHIYGGTTAGSSNAFTATLTPNITAYSLGMLVVLKADRANTGAATLNIDSIGAKDIKKYAGATNLVANDILAGQTYVLEYDTASGGYWNLINPSNPQIYGANIQGLTASRALSLDASKNLVTLSAADFRSLIGAAASGENSDITALTGIALSSYTPAVTASGSMSISSLAINDAKYQRIGGFIEGYVSCNFTLGGVADQFIYVTAPVAGSVMNANVTLRAGATENGSAVNEAAWRYDAGSNRFIVFKPALANWTLGVNGSVHIGFRYPA